MSGDRNRKVAGVLPAASASVCVLYTANTEFSVDMIYHSLGDSPSFLDHPKSRLEL
jgi:hypothetical protein